MAEGEECGGFCGGVDGDGRERVRVLGREALWSCSQKGSEVLERRWTFSH
jgi:hypothetical protein